MMVEICNMILVPIVAGLIANEILYGRNPIWKRGIVLGTVATTACVVAATVLTLPLSPAPRNGLLIGILLIGLVAVTKLIIEVGLKRQGDWMDEALSFFSMLGICFIVAIITSRSRDKLLEVGVRLVLAVVLHNSIGYFLGYWGARLARLDEKTARTVSIEVGMQNGGMASALAMGVLNSPSAALAAAIFGPYMSISGALLATWWKRNPAPEHTPISTGSTR
jgi:bile acid:Na+ symporter, BASS family